MKLPPRLTTTHRKKIAFISLLLLSAALLIPAYFFLQWRISAYLKQIPNYVLMPKKLARDKNTPLLSAYQLQQLGWTHHHRHLEMRQSYLAFPVKKSPNAVRIGIFGGSLSQHKKNFDGAFHLQEEFKRAGYNNVEVINFGVAAYGVNQMYLLWEYVGRRYNLDYVIFEFPFAQKRDLGFSRFLIHPILHARFIQDGNDVKLIELPGKNRKQALDNYYRVIPRLRFLRYDQQQPILLRALGLMPMWKINPFYYQDDSEAELGFIYQKLLERIASTGVKVIATYDETLKGKIEELAKANIASLHRKSIACGANFLSLQKDRAHFTELAFQNMAKEYFSYLTGSENFVLNTPELHFSDAVCEDFKLEELFLSHQDTEDNYWRRAQLMLDNKAISDMLPLEMHFGKAKGVLFLKLNFRHRSYPNKECLQGEPIAIGLPFKPKRNSIAHLHFFHKKKIKRVPIGRLCMLRNDMAFLVNYSEEVIAQHLSRILGKKLNVKDFLTNLHFPKEMNIRSTHLTLDERVVAKIRKNRIDPLIGKSLLFSTTSIGENSQAELVKKGGQLSIWVNHKTTSRSIPFAKIEPKRTELEFDDTDYRVQPIRVDR